MNEGRFSVIIPAAGVGKRTGEEVPKQWLELGGEPMLARVLRIFEGLEGIGSVVVALNADELEERSKQILSYGLKLTLQFCAGGRRRQNTVASALETLAVEDHDIVVIHDAARPFASKGLVKAVVAKAQEGQAAIAATPVTDTIKEVDRVGWVLNTPRRSFMWQAQTPQAVRAGILRRGLALAAQREIELTDDAIAAELMGFRVAVVSGEEGNMKITTKRDLEFARFLVERGDLKD